MLRQKIGGDGGGVEIPHGMTPAICISMIELGTSIDRFTNKERTKVSLGFELPAITYEKDGQVLPSVRSWSGTFSLYEGAQLYKHLDSWVTLAGLESLKDEEGFVLLRGVVGLAATLNIGAKKDGTGAVIKGIMPAMPGQGGEQPTQVNPSVVWELDVNNKPLTPNLWPQLPDFIKKQIRESFEWAQIGPAVTPYDVAPSAAPQGAAPVGMVPQAAQPPQQYAAPPQTHQVPPDVAAQWNQPTPPPVTLGGTAGQPSQVPQTTFTAQQQAAAPVPPQASSIPPAAPAVVGGEQPAAPQFPTMDNLPPGLQ